MRRLPRISERDGRTDELLLWRGLAPPRVVLSIVVLVLLLIDPRGQAMDSTLRLGVTLTATTNLTLSLAPGVANNRGGVALRVVLDTMLALALLLLADPRATPLMWVALLVPVMGAATLSPLFAGLTWAAVSILYSTMRIVSPDSADATFSVGVQQLLAVGLIGIPLAHWSFEAGARLHRASGDKRMAHQQVWRLRNVSHLARTLGQAKDRNQIDEALITATSLIDADRIELWELDNKGPRLVGASGRAMTSPTQVLIEDCIRGRTVDSADLDVIADLGSDTSVIGSRGGAVIASGYGLALAAGLRARAGSGLRFWFLEPNIRPEHIEAIDLLVKSADQAYENAGQVERLTSWSEQLDHQARHDELTGLLNRVGLKSAVADIAAPSVLYLDLDGFKPVNDVYGHDVGDRTLQLVGQRFASCLPSGATLARIGGDEFVVVGGFDDQELTDLQAALERSLDEPLSIGPHRVEVGVSVGIAGGDDGDDLEELMTTADRDMYSRKRPSTRTAGEARADTGAGAGS